MSKYYNKNPALWHRLILLILATPNVWHHTELGNKQRVKFLMCLLLPKSEPASNPFLKTLLGTQKEAMSLRFSCIRQ